MVDIEIDQSEGVVILKPDDLSRLSQADIKDITDQIDGYLTGHVKLRGLVIIADR